MPLDPQEMQTALDRIAAWQSDTEAPAVCPRCGAFGLSIVDQSARPYAEWYKLSCPACGLDETIHIPLGPPVMGGLD